jgi:putative oxidoreductase
MSPIRTLARPLLAAPFVADAVSRLRSPGATAASLRPQLRRLARRFPAVRSLADRPELFTRTVGGIEIGASALLALGKAPRLSAALIVATQAATLPADLVAAKSQGTLVSTGVTRAGLVGGALVASVDGGSRNKIKAVRAHAAKATKRAQRRARRAEARAEQAVKATSDAARDA